MHLRKASKKDMDAASSLFTQLLKYESRFEKKNIPQELTKFKRRFLNEKDYICFLVFQNKEAIAFADAHDQDIFGIGKNAGYIRNVFVKQAFRGKGVGKLLLTHVLRWVKKKHIVLDIYAKNRAAYKAWQAMGFKPTRKHGKFLRMEKLL
jgi:GNAT superfamily N-acetyltransferase